MLSTTVHKLNIFPISVCAGFLLQLYLGETSWCWWDKELSQHMN